MKTFYRRLVLAFCIILTLILFRKNLHWISINVKVNLRIVQNNNLLKELKEKSEGSDGKHKYDVLVVGAGLSGAVLAHLHATVLNQSVLVVEKRNHIAGNIYDFDNELGIRVSLYGAHLFHTNDEQVWRFVNKFSRWTPYQHRVIGKVDNKLVPIPVNIQTVNSLMEENLKNHEHMQKWLKVHQEDIPDPKNGEEAGLARVGKELYEKIFKTYTKKQWNKFPAELDPSILQRIPVRDDFDDRYFPDDPYQALPVGGYTAFARNMLTHARITTHLGVDYIESGKNGHIDISNFKKVFFTGPIDRYYAGRGLDSLEYRSIKFETLHFENISYYQSNSVVNYPQGPETFTRIVEYKHLYTQYTQETKGTTIVREYSTDKGDPYYPVLNEKNRILYSKYRNLAESEESSKNVHFVGRLASFKYFNMDQAIQNAINEFKKIYEEEGVSFEDEKIYGKTTLKDMNRIFNRAHNNPSLSIITTNCENGLDFLQQFTNLCNTHDVSIYIYQRCGVSSDLSGEYGACRVNQVKLPETTSVSQTWLFHMLYKSFGFKNINIFLPNPPEFHRYQDVMAVIDRMQQNVKSFEPSDYIKIPREEMAEQFDTNASYICSLSQLNSKTYAKNMCEWYSLLTGTKENCLNFRSSSGGEFLVTEALIRRTISMHRQWMESMYGKMSKETDSIYMERLWTRLFRGPTTISKEERLKCYFNEAFN